MLRNKWWAPMMCATVLLTACAGEPSDGKAGLLESSQVSLPNPLPAVTQHSTLPYDDLRLSAAERDRLDLAYNNLVEVCAKRAGVTLTRVEDDPKALGPEFALWAGRFGTLPLEQAKKYGYHAVPGEPVTKPWSVFTEEDVQPTLGVVQGCRGEVARKVGGDPNALGPDNAEQLRLAALRDSRTVEASKQWSACMRARGYKYAKVDDPIDEALGKRLAAREKSIAVADVGCTRSSKWRDISFAIERELQLRSIEVHKDRYGDDLKAERQMLERAESLAKNEVSP